MRSFAFESEYAYSGNKILVPTSLILGSQIEIAFEAVLDTGAEITLLSRLLARGLPSGIEDGEPINLGVVSGHSSTAYVHEVRLRVLGQERRIRAAFCRDWDTDNYLGMQGFFDQVLLAFDHAQRKVYF